MRKYLFFLALILSSAPAFAQYSAAGDTVKFICNELIGRPTGNSVVVNICTDKNIDAYIEYGFQKNNFVFQTSVNSYQGNIPFNIQISNLSSGFTYYYRLRYRITGTSQFLARAERAFKTAKPKGTSFSFAIEADPHFDNFTDPELVKLTFKNIESSNPDFVFDLGDTFMCEKLQNPTQDSITYRHLLLRSYFDLICHSIPLYLVIGNHEGELGWLLNGTANNLAVQTSNTRLKYFPNPLPDAFYSGNTKSEPFVGLRQNYYSWEWGNALFVVLDPYWYTLVKPNTHVDNWSWTLGPEQYLWFKNTLQNSNAKFKFVFAHQIIGGSSTDGRGGTEAVPYYEMGGKNSDGSWGFINKRPNWEMPIHQLMAANHVSAFFHGHDHFYGKQQLDGIIYQEVPQPGNPNYRTPGPAADYGYVTGTILPCSGYIKVSVGETSAVVDYIRSYLPSVQNQDRVNGSISDSYTIQAYNPLSNESNDKIPESFSLYQNYPNPFNPSTTIKYTLPAGKNFDNQFVTLKIYDPLGREIARLVNEYQSPGNYSVVFNADRYTSASGIYICVLTAQNVSKMIKMILIK